MKRRDAFPSHFLKADDLHNKKLNLTISSAEMGKVGEDEKLLIYFKEEKKPLVCNVVNSKSIERIAKTDELDSWTHVKVVLYPTKVDFRGERVDAIRIEAPDEDDIPMTFPKRKKKKG